MDPLGARAKMLGDLRYSLSTYKLGDLRYSLSTYTNFKNTKLVKTIAGVVAEKTIA